MDNIYNTSFDVGVAVKEETAAAAAAPKSSKKKKRRKRKRSGSTSSFDGLPLPPPSTVDDDDVKAADYPTETVTPDNRTDDKAESAVATSETTGKKKKKRRRKKKNDSGTSNADEISTHESKAHAAIAEQGEKQPNSPERCKTSDVDISMPSTGKKKRKKKKKRKNSVTEDGASTKSSPMKTDVGDIIQQTKSTTVPKQGPLKGMFIKERSNLPVFQHRDEICNLVSKNDVLLVVAETVC